MTKRKNAPHLKHSWNNQPFSDLIILTGSSVWEIWNKGDGVAWQMLADGLNIEPYTKDGKAVTRYQQAPVILSSRELMDVARLNIANQSQRFIKLFQCGELSEQHKTAICLNLATHTQAEKVGLYDVYTLDLIEDLSSYIQRLRTDESTRETAEQVAQSTTTGSELSNDEINLESPTTTEQERVNAFLNWHPKPLARDLLQAVTYAYNGTYWENITDEMLKREIVKFYNHKGANYTTNRISRLADVIILNLPEMSQESNHYIGFKNGVINKMTGEFLPHAPTYYLKGVEDVEVKISENTPHFFDWLEWVADGDDERRKVILAGLYMILTNRNEWQLFLEVVGDGGAGKGIYSNISAIINGKYNTAYASIKDLEDEKVRAKLIGKSLSISADQQRYTGDGDALKSITGGDKVSVKMLYKDHFDVLLEIVMMIVTNYPLTFTDRNGGIARRRVIITFNKKFPENKKDPYFIEKIRPETYGIINYILKAFPDPEQARATLENYKIKNAGVEIKAKSNHLIDFAKAFKVEPITNDTTAKERTDKINGLYWGSNASKKSNHQALFNAYLFYCLCQGQKPLSVNGFKQALPDALKETGETEKIYERLKDNTTITNIYWKGNPHAILNEWQG